MPPPAPPAERSDHPRIGLALSGGGFRATLYHLGVIRFLYEAGLLRHVSHITSVSGGSIFAAHLVLNWERYTGSEEEFQEAAAEIASFMKLDLRGKVLRSWLFSFAALSLPRMLARQGWTRTGLLQSNYARLYGNKTLLDLQAATSASTPRPHLYLLATSMTTGHLVSFGESEMKVHDGAESGGYPQRSDGQTRSSRTYPAGSVAVALAVACSSAFPPLFPPVRVTSETFGNHSGFLEQDHYLADGGIFDNLGIRKLLWLNREVNADFDLVVVADAQCETAREYTKPYQWIWDRAARASDLLMNRVSWLEDAAISQLGKEARCDLLRCQLQCHVPPTRPYALSDAEQLSIQHVRTDLDVFSPHEINALVHQGTAVARVAWAEQGREGNLARVEANGRFDLERKSCWLPLPAPSDPPFSLLGADRRKAGLFRAAEWTSWALWLLVGVWFVVTPLGCLGWQIKRRNAAERGEAIAKQREEEAKQMAIHVRKKHTLIQLLADVTLSTNPEEFEFAVKQWDKFTTNLLEDEQFYFWIGEDIDEINAQIATKKLQNEDLEVSTLALARKVGKWIQATNEEGYLAVLREMRAQWYDEVVEAVQRMLQDVKIQNHPISRQRFWKLYWGEMGMVEGQDVAAAMARCGALLKKWEKQPEGRDGRLTADLREACASLESECEKEKGRPLPYQSEMSR